MRGRHCGTGMRIHLIIIFIPSNTVRAPIQAPGTQIKERSSAPPAPPALKVKKAKESAARHKRNALEHQLAFQGEQQQGGVLCGLVFRVQARDPPHVSLFQMQRPGLGPGAPRRAACRKVQTFPVTCSWVSVCAWLAIDSDSGLHGAHCASPRDGEESRNIRSAR